MNTNDPREPGDVSPRYIPYHGCFVKPSDQLLMVREWNHQRGWGFTPADFDAVCHAPAWPEKKYATVVLAPALHSVVATLKEAVFCIRTRLKLTITRDLVPDSRCIHLAEGTYHVPGLEWQVIDLVAKWDRVTGKAPSKYTIRSSRLPAHGLLWAAALFPGWASMMDGRTVPYIWLPGYKVSRPKDYWCCTPRLRWFHSSRSLHLSVMHSHVPAKEWAIPQFV